MSLEKKDMDGSDLQNGLHPGICDTMYGPGRLLLADMFTENLSKD